MPVESAPSPALREYRLPLAIILILSVLSVLLHTKWCATPMLSSEEQWQKIISYHQEFYPFSIRYLTTCTVVAFHTLAGLPLKLSFFLLQYLLAGVTGLAFYRYLRLLGCGIICGNTGLFLLMASFPVLFAHSDPVFTWDDFWVYLGLVGCCAALVRHRPIAASLWFTLALFGREQTLFYYPVLVIGLWFLTDDRTSARSLAAAALPLVIFLPVLGALWQSPDPMRYRLLEYNFADYPRISNSLFSVFVSFGFLWVAWIAGLMRKSAVVDNNSRSQDFLFWGSVLAVVPTIIVGISFAYARETRIFFPPFVLVFPIALMLLRNLAGRLRRSERHWLIAPILAISLIAGIVAGNFVFREFDYRNCPDFCRPFAGVHIGLSIALIWLMMMAGRATSSEVPISHSDHIAG